MLLDMLIFMLDTNRDFELQQAYLNLFLKVPYYVIEESRGEQGREEKREREDRERETEERELHCSHFSMNSITQITLFAPPNYPQNSKHCKPNNETHGSDWRLSFTPAYVLFSTSVAFRPKTTIGVKGW